MDRYSHAICRALAAFGIHASIRAKVKARESAIESAFVKANTREYMLETEIPLADRKRVHIEQQLKVRIEIDTDPPPQFLTEEHFLFDPLSFAVCAYSSSDLFAGKLHAILTRNWIKGVKGRDWWDLVWFVGRAIPVHLAHLEARLRQSIDSSDVLTLEELVDQLYAKIESLDLESAKADIRPFIADASALDLWSVNFFKAVVQKIRGS